MVDTPREAMELFGSAPVDLLAHRPVRGAPGARRSAPVSRRDRGVTVVVPTLGRPSLAALLAALARRAGWTVRCWSSTTGRTGRRAAADPGRRRRKVLRRPRRRAGRRPQRRLAGRPAPSGWRSSTTTCCPTRTGRPGCAADLAAAPARRRRRAGQPAGAAAGRPPRRPTGNGSPPALADGDWITADMAYRRAALDARRRLRRAAAAGVPGGRRAGPPGAPGRLARWPAATGRSPTRYARRAAGSACAPSAATPTTPCCAGCTARTGATVLGIPPGRRARHVAVTAAGPRAGRCWPPDRRGCGRRRPALAWAAGTAEFAAARIAPGPRDRARGRHHAGHQRRHPAASPTAHWLRGWFAAPRAPRPLETRR